MASFGTSLGVVSIDCPDCEQTFTVPVTIASTHREARTVVMEIDTDAVKRSAAIAYCRHLVES